MSGISGDDVTNTFYFNHAAVVGDSGGITGTHAQGGGSAIAENLIRAMRLDQFALQGAHASYLMKPRVAGPDALTDGQRRDFLRCLEGADTSLIVRALANVLARQVSPGEMQEALAFYSSSAGKKQAQREMIEAQRRLGYELAAASPALSGRERASLDRFRRTPTYAKLEELPVKIREVRETQMAIYQGSQLAAEACSQAVGLTR